MMTALCDNRAIAFKCYAEELGISQHSYQLRIIYKDRLEGVSVAKKCIYCIAYNFCLKKHYKCIEEATVLHI